MGIKRAHLWDVLRTSLWFIPGSMAVGAIALSAVVLEVDARFPLERAVGLPLLYGGGPAGASDVLTVIAGSMIGVTGVVFSVTIVALSLASTQFGPRLLRTFMRDPANTFVLGTFIATFIFSLLGLRAVGAPGAADPVPELTVTVAIVLALASLAMLIFFIHHIASSIRAEAVIADVSKELDRSIDHLYPEEIGEGIRRGVEGIPGHIPDRLDEEGVDLRARKSGYLQAVDEDRLIRLAVEHDLLLQLHHRPGDFLLEGSVLLSAWPRDRVDGEASAKLADLFIVGRKRTAEQDVEFSINQLVEVASRSLSTGINDPFTAIACVDRLGAALCSLCQRRFPSPYREDGAGRLRVIARREDFEGLANAAFDPLRQYARPSVPVTIRILEAIETVAGCVGPVEGYRRALRYHADKVYHAARTFGHEPSDLEDIRERYERATRALEPPEAGPGAA